MTPPNATTATRKSKAAVKLPVACLIMPTIDGPARPPRLPTELTSARPAAAPVPVRIAVGSDQKCCPRHRCRPRRE